MTIAETNINWSKLRRSQTLPFRCRRWFETSKVSVSYNQHQKRSKSKYQPGGTAVISTGEMALRAGKQEQDSRKLGRWSSQILHGKQGIVTRIISVYVPIMMSSFGSNKVASQQQRALLKMGVKENVYTVFWQDFWRQIDKWLDEGEQLVICGDWNRDITNKSFIKEFEKRNLIPAIASKHGTQLPATYNNGSAPIGEIFCSKTLQIISSGYLGSK